MKIRHIALVLVFVAISLSFTTTLFARNENTVFFPIVQNGSGSIPVPTPEALSSAGCDDCVQESSWCEPPTAVDADHNALMHGLAGPPRTDPNYGERWYCDDE